MKPPRAIRSPLPPKASAIFLVCAAMLTWWTGTAAAQNEFKVAVVDIARIFKEYNRTHELDAKIDEANNSYSNQLNERVEAHHRLVEAVAQADRDLGQPNLSAAGRAERQTEREKTIAQLQQNEQEAREFKAVHERGLQEMIVRARTQVVEDVMVVINARVETRHYDLVLNRSAKVADLRAVVLYANDSLDITSDIIATLNKDHPAAKPTPLTDRKID